MSDECLCIDTNVMLWGILRLGQNQKETEMIEKAGIFFEQAFQSDKVFAISVITLAEIMAVVPIEEQEKYLEILEQNFIILPYSKNAALLAAKIFQEQYGKMKPAYHGKRAIVRQDMQILASALAFSDKITLITEDGPFRKLAEKYLAVSKIPDREPEQGVLFNEI